MNTYCQANDTHPLIQCERIDHNGDFGWLKCNACGQEFQGLRLTPASQKQWDKERPERKKNNMAGELAPKRVEDNITDVVYEWLNGNQTTHEMLEALIKYRALDFNSKDKALLVLEHYQYHIGCVRNAQSVIIQHSPQCFDYPPAQQYYNDQFPVSRSFATSFKQLEGHLTCSRTINTQTGQSEIYKHCPPCPDAGYSGQATPTVKIWINNTPLTIVPGSYKLSQVLSLCGFANYPQLYWCSPKTIPRDLCHPDRKYLRVTHRTQINISGDEHFITHCPASKIYQEIEEAKLILENGAVPFEPVQGHTPRADGVIPTTTAEPFLPIEQSVKSFDPINTILTRLDRLENRATVLEKLEKRYNQSEQT